MVKLAYEIAPLLTHLEYLGKGIEMRSFEAERKRPWIDTLAVYLSMSTAGHSRDTNRQATFYDILAVHNPHDAISSVSLAGAPRSISADMPFRNSKG